MSEKNGIEQSWLDLVMDRYLTALLTDYISSDLDLYHCKRTIGHLFPHISLRVRITRFYQFCCRRNTMLEINSINMRVFYFLPHIERAAVAYGFDGVFIVNVPLEFRHSLLQTDYRYVKNKQNYFVSFAKLFFF
jgi:hypothetical protein